MTDKEHLQWIYDRLVHVYGEDTDVNYMQHLKSIIDRSSDGPPKLEVRVKNIETLLIKLVECNTAMLGIGTVTELLGVLNENT